MSGLRPEASRSTHQDAPQVAEGLLNAPFNMAQGTGHPVMHSFPGSSQPPVALLPNGTFCAIPPFARGAYGPNYTPTLQGHSTIPTPDLRRPMNNRSLMQRAVLNNTFLRNATSATTLQLSRPAGYLEPPTPVTFQPPLTNMQPKPPLSSGRQQGQQPLQTAQQGLGANKPPKEPGQVRREGHRSDKGRRVAHIAAAIPLHNNQTNNQVRPGQNHLQTTRQDNAVEKPSEQSGQVHRTDCPPDTDSRVTHVVPAANPQNDQTNNQADRRQNHLQAVQQDNAAEKLSKEPGQVDAKHHQPGNGPCAAPEYPQSDETSILFHPLERNFSVHTCLDNSESLCARTGSVCLDAFRAFIRECPSSVTLSLDQISEYIYAAMFPDRIGEEQLAGQPAQVDATDATWSNNINTPSSCGTASPGSSTAASSSTAVYWSPTGSSLSAPEQLQAARSPSTSSTSCSAGKRQRSEDCSEDRPQKQQRMDCSDTVPVDHPEACDEEMLDCTQDSQPPEKEKYEYICRICMIHAKAVAPLPCINELRSHIESMHEPFLVLFDHEEFNILQPQRSDRYENLVPLIRFCIPLQLQAQRRGVVIPPDRDLTTLYPHIAAFLHHC